MLEQIAAEMKAKALSRKLDVKRNQFPPAADSTKRVAVGDVLCHLLFTCDVVAEDKCFWHLSLSTIPYGPVPQETAEFVRKAFFSDTDSLEMPSFLHGKNMKQYLARIS